MFIIPPKCSETIFLSVSIRPPSPSPPSFSRAFSFIGSLHEGVDQFYAQNFDSSITILITTIIICDVHVGEGEKERAHP